VGFGSAEIYKEDESFIKAIFGAGVYGFFAFTEKDHRLVGLARVLSDDKVCSWIAEVCVHPDWQGKGVGGKLLDMVINRFGHTAIYVEAFADQTEFFANRGIKPKKKLVACSRAGQESATQDTEPFIH
ncbi:MAG: GNAT family N-acetyltransferase, partial [Gammaproteobacteria bacterium]|nr:GNAT family N-acetyltransferase [Gammaproteobacteria bacterium]